MAAIVVVIFVGIFAVVALLMMASGTGASRETKQVLARLDSALTLPLPSGRNRYAMTRSNPVSVRMASVATCNNCSKDAAALRCNC